MSTDDDTLEALLAEATPGPWLGVIKPNGRGVGMIGDPAKRGTGGQGCIAVIQSIPGGKERVANTDLIALAPELAAEVLALRKERAAAQAAIQAMRDDEADHPDGPIWCNFTRELLATYDAWEPDCPAHIATHDALKESEG